MSATAHKRRFSEAAILAELYHQLRIVGLSADMEVDTYAGRLDMAVYSPIARDEYCLIIEGKKRKGLIKEDQLVRYRSLGLPVITVSLFWDGFAMARRIKEQFSQPHYSVSRELLENAKAVIRPKTVRRSPPRVVVYADSELNIRQR